MKVDSNNKEESSIPSLNRRDLIIAGATVGAGILGAGLLGGNTALAHGFGARKHQGSLDQKILNAAATAEALATVMYYGIINIPNSIYSVGLLKENPNRAYLVSAYEQEFNHYNFLVSAGAAALTTTFYFPENMFVDPQTTLNTLVTLEDAFIAAYLIGVRDLAEPSLKVIASQIMGVEAEHRALARVIVGGLGLTAVTGLSGVAERTDPHYYTSNNLCYERTFSSALPDIDHVVAALGPFVTPGAGGFSPTAYTLYWATRNPSAWEKPVQEDDTTP